jgi:phosphoribosyl-ATP pyrophosphohydrolase/phosphoribosyl-AMP cyclohydrolase
VKASLDFEKGNGLIPAIVQDRVTQKVLMLGYMNSEAYERTLESCKVTFWSRSRKALWTKGETSGNFLQVKEIKVDCDQDTLLIMADPVGPVCHTGADTCFDESNDPHEIMFIKHLYDVIDDRYNDRSDASYTSSLFDKGINKVAQKVGEEAVELVIEAMDDNLDLFKNEATDLLYHYLVLLRAKGVSLNDIIEVLQARHSK